jgi:hypothetical protein
MFPDGFFINDLLFFGTSLSRETYLSKGVRLTVPDMRSAGLGVLQEILHGNMRLLLLLFANKMALQVNWTVEDDYYGPLCVYAKDTEASLKAGTMNRWTELNRRFRHAQALEQLRAGGLRRERVYMYFGAKCDSLEAADLTNLESYEMFMRQQATNFSSKLACVQSLYPQGVAELMSDEDHCLHWRKSLNPSMTAFLSGDRKDALNGFNREKTILQNTCRSDVLAFKLPKHSNAFGLTFDGMYHTLFVMRCQPTGTRLGDMLPLLSSVSKGVTVTMNIYPQDIEREVEMTKEERAELLKYINDPKSYGVQEDVSRLGNKIALLLRREILPFRVLWVVKVSGASLDELNNRSLSVKTALSTMEGLEYHQCNEPTQATNLFHETLPGWLGSTYRGWDVYWENKNLRDALPVSSTFVGHLDDNPMAIYNTPGGGLAALRLLTRNGTPQHTCCVGVNGSGKTSVTIDLLTQVAHQAGYIAIFEEGLAYDTFARLNRLQSIVPRPGSPYTLNPFDTMGMPLSDENIREVVTVCMKLVGASQDQDRNKAREALIAEYVSRLTIATAKTFLQQDAEREMTVARLALVCERRLAKMPVGSTMLDAFTELRELRSLDPAQHVQILAEPSKQEVLAFLSNPATKHEVHRFAFSQFEPDQYPRFGQLWSIMKSGRLPHHRSSRMEEELDRLVSAMAKGKAVGGTIGKLIDGVSNIRLDRGLHVDYSYLPDGELKEIAGYIFPARVRQYIVTRPRSELKIVVWEELRRLLRIPNSAEMVKETLAQFRKYKACAILAFQTPAQIEELDPGLLDLILSECKQHLLLRLNSRTQVDRIGNVIGLPQSAREAIMSYDLVEHQRGPVRAAYLTLFAKEGDTPTCGTVMNTVNPYMLYVASSNGDVFDQRQKALAKYDDPFDAVLAEVSNKQAASPRSDLLAATR